jgi:hypothetical protein
MDEKCVPVAKDRIDNYPSVRPSLRSGGLCQGMIFLTEKTVLDHLFSKSAVIAILGSGMPVFSAQWTN